MWPNTIQMGDGANNGSLQNTQPSKAIFPLMYLFKNTTTSTSEKQKWQLVIQQTLNFIKYQLPNYNNLLPYFGNDSHQYGSDSARNVMNLGGLIIAINNNKQTTQISTYKSTMFYSAFSLSYNDFSLIKSHYENS